MLGVFVLLVGASAGVELDGKDAATAIVALTKTGHTHATSNVCVNRIQDQL
ncbi:hypothetical protein TUN199_09977 [Pyrenophora tritici-repentis]|uniref:Uncharacterized protein n=1 Tax=Pyrenophora tritici-repentis TaxID=45151 RepID=A0A5M9LDN4_9PLEO|nr:hypothetical protein PtrV1_06105 [Pyrenophora tritici-repentis]KAF7573490.1 hypothetical protein PtrM4_083950 [Pyrenophora tritici-repentis]KAI0573066.1 hypothetical protein Alg215_09398 [Pyrenophora tritici-repentis]KAI0583530.1 hypothetical protein Alg130_05647 [Pyrenophora tritici-repentis]KAI0604049.1 hypothetical protein TUN205_11703 [Pyrenophora tritici-repentis]